MVIDFFARAARPGAAFPRRVPAAAPAAGITHPHPRPPLILVWRADAKGRAYAEWRPADGAEARSASAPEAPEAPGSGHPAARAAA